MLVSMLILWLPVAAYMAAIFWFSSQPVLPGVALLPAWLSHDWLHHGAAYAGLALITLRAVAAGAWRGVTAATLLAAWAIAVVYGLTDEWHQSFVPGRTPDGRDVLADAAGAALGLGAAWAWSIIRRPS